MSPSAPDRLRLLCIIQGAAFSLDDAEASPTPRRDSLFRTTPVRVVGVFPRTLDRNQVLAVAGASTGHIENLTPDQVKLDAARTLVRRPTVGRGRRIRRSPVGDVRHRAVRASHHLGGEPTARERRGCLWADATAVRLERDGYLTVDQASRAAADPSK